MTHEVVFAIMLIIATLSLLYPWHPSWPAAKWLLHLPWILIPLWLFYEWLMPDTTGIRMDLLAIVFELGIAFVVYAVRLLLFWYLTKRVHLQDRQHDE